MVPLFSAGYFGSKNPNVSSLVVAQRKNSGTVSVITMVMGTSFAALKPMPKQRTLNLKPFQPLPSVETVFSFFIIFIINKIKLVFCFFQVFCCLSVQLLLLSSSLVGEAVQEGARHSKSLLNTFPFSLAENKIDETNSISRQGDGGVDFNDVAEAASTGQRCVDKVCKFLPALQPYKSPAVDG